MSSVQHGQYSPNLSALSCPAVIVNQLDAVYKIIPPASKRLSPVVAASPHSGRRYTNAFIQQSTLPLEQLRQVEDAAMDRLLTFQPLPSPLLLAEFPRSFVDVNRRHDEIDSAMFDGPVDIINAKMTRYLRSGLGMIPKKAAEQKDIYSSPLPADEVTYRRQHYYTPYHKALNSLVETAARAGHALLLDCHSMPSGLFGVDSDIILGSNHGLSARPWVVDSALEYFSREGLSIRLNTPFSGGFITKHYGKPQSGISTLQIEVCRSLYLNEQSLELKSDWSALASIICRFILHMDELMIRRGDDD
jgi:N-formylglutamate deformylase